MAKAKKEFDVLVLPGDGIGIEVTDEALKVLKAASDRHGLTFNLTSALLGGAAIDAEGAPVSDKTMKMAAEADAILLGAVGGTKWDDLPTNQRPEIGLLGMRRELDIYANLRPAQVFEPLADASTLKREVVRGLDLLVVRELVSDLYFGEPRGIRQTDKGREGFNTMRYYDWEIERVVRKSFEIARTRRSKLTSVDKENVLETSRLWREVVLEVAPDYPDVELNHMYVDNCAMQLIRDPSQFDVIVTGNIFGDIISDESSMLTGSIGMLPSASLGDGVALFEPIHGSAPDIAGQNKANPFAMILSAAMMLEISCHEPEAAASIRSAVNNVLVDGFRTVDIAEDGSKVVSCSEMGDLVAERVSGS
ncbi:MAG: 3-isopropylmalate dehydrogenase [Pseudomonadota bacterium]|jgi:3-isopropylmalate dehydrogenase